MATSAIATALQSRDDVNDIESSGISVAGSSVSMAGLRKEFGSFVAVDDVSLDIAAGEFVSLLGPSGSGKTTILMMLAGFESPTSGLVAISGSDVTGVPPYKRDIGMVFQSYALFPHMTVYENIAYPLKLRRMRKDEIRRRVAWAMETVRLPIEMYADRRPSQLSGGQRQRVALVRALVYEPAVVLMDEPMGALDKNLREELKLELMALRSRLKLTIMYVTHDQSEALMLSDRVAVMRDGRIEQIDRPQLLYKRPKTEFVANFLGEANIFDVERSGESQFSLRNGVVYEAGVHLESNRTDQWVMMVRPEQIELVNQDEADFCGTIENLAFLGGTVRAELDTPVGQLTVLANSSRLKELVIGEIIGVRLATEEIVYLPSSKKA